MRLFARNNIKFNEGDTRIASGFLWLPKNICGEWRWLEHARWKQTVKKLTALTPDTGSYSPGQTYLSWVNTDWMKL